MTTTLLEFPIATFAIPVTRDLFMSTSKFTIMCILLTRLYAPEGQRFKKFSSEHIAECYIPSR